jgi:DNA-directed RNA polymerase subunit H (RpoH/RPB5)
MLETSRGYKCSRTAMLEAQKQIKELQMAGTRKTITWAIGDQFTINGTHDPQTVYTIEAHHYNESRVDITWGSDPANRVGYEKTHITEILNEKDSNWTLIPKNKPADPIVPAPKFKAGDVVEFISAHTQGMSNEAGDTATIVSSQWDKETKEQVYVITRNAPYRYPYTQFTVSEQFIKSHTKTKETVMPKMHKVTSKFIIAGHKEACAPWQKELEAKFPQVFPPKTESKISVKVGGIYQLPTYSGRSRYILASVGSSKVVLISLENGNRWCEPVTTSSTGKFTLEDVKKIFEKLDLKQVTGDDGSAIIVPAVTSKIPVSVEVDEEFILNAHAAAPSNLAKKIKENFPQVFNNSPYAKLIDEDVTGSTLSLSASGTRLDRGINIGIADGFAPTENQRKRSIYVNGDNVEDVTVEKYNGRWIISIKKKP